jgi:ectoine hydroxylase-related dioxygenase (phytanoyl-CoA dioxygenase family)
METVTFELAKPYTITAEQAAQYRRDGHILLRGVISEEELEYFRPLIMRVADDASRARQIGARLGDAGMLFREITNVWRLNEAIQELVFAKRLARIAAELMGVRGVRLYHDAVLIKDPGGKPTPWHKDHYYWPLATHHTIKMWMALTDIPRERGAMRFATGSHHGGAFPEIPISPSSQELFDRIIHDHRIPVASYTLRAGDATFHSGEILHSTLENSGTGRREVLAICYYEDGTRVLVPDHEHRRVDLQEFLPGLQGGDFAATALNPLLYDSTEGAGRVSQ